MQARKVIASLLAIATALIFTACFAMRSKMHRLETEKVIYEDRAESWERRSGDLEEQLTEQQAVIDKAYEDVEQALNLVSGYNLVHAEPVGEMLVTCYDTNCKVCDTGSVTCSGMRAIPGVVVAADLKIYPIGTVLLIEGVGIRTVADTGGAVKPNQLDLLVDDAHGKEAKEIYGKRKVWVIQYAG